VGFAMSVELRLTRELLYAVHEDLSRPHPYAAERVGFVTFRPAILRGGALALLGEALHPVADEDYEDDPTVGAMLGSSAFRKILELAYKLPVSVLHVHRHEHFGRPWFSGVDLRDARKYVPDFWKVRKGFPHGIMVLSQDSASGLIWLPNASAPVRAPKISIVGTPVQEIYAS
jgi:hypothetical protein